MVGDGDAMMIGVKVAGTGAGVRRVAVASGAGDGSKVAFWPPEGDRQAARRRIPIKNNFFMVTFSNVDPKGLGDL